MTRVEPAPASQHTEPRPRAFEIGDLVHHVQTDSPGVVTGRRAGRVIVKFDGVTGGDGVPVHPGDLRHNPITGGGR